MDFSLKKKLYKKEKYELPKIIKDNKEIFFGSGGSNNVTIIHNDVALKIIPEFNKYVLEKIKRNNDQKEIDHYVLFTNEFLIPKITPHIVGYYSHYKLYDIKPLFPKQCMSMNDLLMVHPSKIDHAKQKLCKMKRQYENKIIAKADLIVLEKCSDTIQKQINPIIKNKEKLEEFINRTIFQFIFTMAQIQKKYPNFIHNDMFLRNILGVVEGKFEENECIEYIWNNESYYLPANGFYLKINDFGYSLNSPKIVSTLEKEIEFNPDGNMEIHNKKRDIYTFLYDYYDGSNLGHSSVMELLGAKSKIRKDIRKVFGKYLDVKVIDQVNKFNRNLVAWQWNIGNVSLLKDTIMLPHEYFSKGVFDKFKKRNGCKIVQTFG